MCAMGRGERGPESDWRRGKASKSVESGRRGLPDDSEKDDGMAGEDQWCSASLLLKLEFESEQGRERAGERSEDSPGEAKPGRWGTRYVSNPPSDDIGERGD